MTVAPMKIGMYHFVRMMTSKSTPVVVTISPERIRVASAAETLLDAPAAQVQVKSSRMTGALTLLGPQGKCIIAALGSNSGGSLSSEQETEIHEAQEAASRHPDNETIELAGLLWLGRPVTADGSYQGAIRSMAQGEARDQRQIGAVVKDALLAVGAQPV